MDSKEFAKVFETLEALLEVPEERREAEARRRLADHPDALAEVLSSLPFLSADPAADERFPALRVRSGDDLIGKTIADRYHLDALVNRGGIGVIYAATDRQLDRQVAVKVLHPGFLASPVARARFARESRSAALLEHENIARVYDSGEDADDLQFCVMEYVAGGRTLQGHSCEAREAARLIAAVCRGLAHSHERRVVHRDIKPSNILLTNDGVPKIADFGLAQDERFAIDRLTRTGELAGTPYYMSPEQVARRRAPITPATDVYSTGAVLYELLTQRPPHEGQTSMEVFEKIRDEVPRRLGPRVPKDLATICMQALRKVPEERYSSASAFAEDLERFLAGEPVAARGERAARRIRRVLRKPAAVWTLVVLLAALGTGWGLYGEAAVRERDREIRLGQEREYRKNLLLIEQHMLGLSDEALPIPRDTQTQDAPEDQ